MGFVKTPVSFVRQIVFRAREVLVHPRDFFQSIKKEEGIKKAFVYLAVLALVNMILGVLAVLIITGASFPVGVIPGLAIDYVFSLLFTFVLAGLFHVWIRIFGGKGGYKQAYRLYIYANTPKFLIGWVPYYIVSILGGIYFLVLAAIGSQELYGFSKKKSIIAFGLLAVILVVLPLLIGFGIAALLSSMGISPFGK